MRRRSIASAVTIVAALALNALAGAQTKAQTDPAHMDWSGYYIIARGKDLQNFKQVPEDLNPLIIAHLQPWARMKLEGTDGIADDNGQTCQPIGIFRYPLLAGQFTWLAGREKIVVASWEINTAGVRRIYLNRGHPKHLLPTWNGDSVGHWEGDTLVVDTTGFNDKSWLHLGMEPHTEELHLTERIRRVGDGSLLEFQGIVEDRQALTSAYAYSRYYKKSDASNSENGLPINICNEDPKLWWDLRNQHLRPAIERSRQVK